MIINGLVFIVLIDLTMASIPRTLSMDSSKLRYERVIVSNISLFMEFISSLQNIASGRINLTFELNAKYKSFFDLSASLLI